jgi:DNA-cytosine methyltransferase
MSKLKVLSLFSGIGLFDYALESSGYFETVAFCEIDKECHKVLNKHWPDVEIFEDISNLTYNANQIIPQVPGRTYQALTDNTKNLITGIDVICGGYPCTGHSVAGKKEGLNNEASNLWYEYLRIIGEVKPRYVIIENSHNLRSTGLAGVIQDICEKGYNCEWQIFSGYGVGSPHQRERIYIVAWREDIPYPDPFRCWPTYSKKKETKSEWWAKRRFTRNPLYSKVGSLEPRVIGTNDGDSNWLYRNEERVRQLGNSLVIDIPKNIAEGIAQFERGCFVGKKCLE